MAPSNIYEQESFACVVQAQQIAKVVTPFSFTAGLAAHQAEHGAFPPRSERKQERRRRAGRNGSDHAGYSRLLSWKHCGSGLVFCLPVRALDHSKVSTPLGSSPTPNWCAPFCSASASISPSTRVLLVRQVHASPPKPCTRAHLLLMHLRHTSRIARALRKVCGEGREAVLPQLGDLVTIWTSKAGLHQLKVPACPPITSPMCHRSAHSHFTRIATSTCAGKGQGLCGGGHHGGRTERASATGTPHSLPALSQ